MTPHNAMQAHLEAAARLKFAMLMLSFALAADQCDALLARVRQAAYGRVV